MKMLRYWVRLLAAFVVRFRIILFVGVVFGLLLFVFLSFLLPRIVSKDTEYIGIAGRYHTDELPFFVLSMVGEGLTKINGKGLPEPALSEKWEANEDGSEWTFFLKEGMHWHDGSTVTSQDIQYSFEDAEVNYPDARTIKFTLASPFSPFPSVVSRPTFKRGLLGTGKWKVSNLSLNGSYVEEIVLKNNEGIKKVMRFYPTEEGAKIAYQLGQVDKLVDLFSTEPFSEWSNSTISETPNNERVVAIFFNNESEAFSGPNNKPLRQALSYALDKASFGGARAIGPISPDSWAYNPLIKDYAFDLERARELTEDFQAETVVNLTTTPTLLPVAEKIAEQWKALDVTTNVQVVSVLPEEYDAFLAIYDMPRDPDQYAIWHTTQTTTNISNYSNPRIDKLLEDGRVITNQDERKKIYLDFQRFLLEDAPAVFLYHPVSYTVTRK
jgi:peptide/nickel transport system substrate-binding protein